MNLEILSKLPFKRVENYLWQLFALFPDLPKSVTKFLAKIAAPLSLIIGIIYLLSLPLSLVHLADVVGGVIGAVLLIAAFKPLRLNRHFGITLLLWNTVFQATLNLFTKASPAILLGFAINVYILYQIKVHFTKK